CSSRERSCPAHGRRFVDRRSSEVEVASLREGPLRLDLHLEADLTVEQGKATCPMSPSGLLKAMGPMSPSQFQRVKFPSHEHKPQFVPFYGETFFSGELRLGRSVEAWEEVRLHSSSLRGVARRRARSSRRL
ncbi:hypothetical protein Taro_045269, partial [Colocasia esculenta]|nr:hypothetical protein [Colocasia esculenta]